LIFFFYPYPKGSEEPSQTLIFSGSSVTPAPGGGEEPGSSLPASSTKSKSIYSPWGWGKKIDFRAINIYINRIVL